GCADEDQPAGRDDRPANTRPTCLLLALGQVVRDPECRLPEDAARSRVDRVQLPPRRLLARQTGFALHETPARRAALVSEWPTGRHQLGDLAEIAGVQIERACDRIESTSSPVVAALQAWKADRGLIEP